MNECIRRMQESEDKRKIAERDSKRAIEAAEKSRAESIAVERENLEAQKLAAERMSTVERTQRRCAQLEKERNELIQSLSQTRDMQQEACARVAKLEAQQEERENEMAGLLGSSKDQRAKTVETFEKLLASERAAKAEASHRAEALSLQIQNMQAQIDSLQGQLTAVRNHETALETRVRGLTDTPPGYEPAAQDMEIDTGEYKRNRIDQFNNGSNFYEGEEGGSAATSSEIPDTTNYKKLTMAKLKQRLTEAGFGEDVLAARNANKKELVELYERLMLNKPLAH
jgi:chromosome segregation ATPase